jgi:hypothetical protein
VCDAVPPVGSLSFQSQERTEDVNRAVISFLEEIADCSYTCPRWPTPHQVRIDRNSMTQMIVETVKRTMEAGS